MSLRKKHITIDQRADYSETFLIEGANSTPYSLYGFTSLQGELRKNVATSNGISLSVSISGAANNGTIALSMNRTITTTLDPSRYFYDVIGTNSANSVIRILEGRATVTPGITR